MTSNSPHSPRATDMLHGSSAPTPGSDTPDAATPATRTVSSAVAAIRATAPSYYGRALTAFTRKVLLFVRQSTMRQVRSHQDSVAVQLKQLRHFNVPEERVITIMALGESGAAERKRDHFEEMLAWIESGEVGAVSVARQDRTGRNDYDNVRLLDALARNGAVLVIDGNVFDPASPEDKMILKIYGSFAEYENQLRARWLHLTALSAAKRLAYRVRLPSPLVWASPDDPEYVARLHAAGLGGWLEGLPQQPTEGRTFSMSEGRRYFPLPYPDRNVVAAAETLIRFVAESETVAEAVLRTFDPAEWPADHLGHMPIVRQRRYAADASAHRPAVTWVPIDREDTADWVLRPGLRGIYQFRSHMMARSVPPEERDEIEVHVPDAFRGLVRPEQAPVLERVVGSGLALRHRRDERAHVVPALFCNHPLDGGGACGARLHGNVQAPGRPARYSGDLCHLRGHSSAVSGCIDGVVLDTIAEALSRERLDAHLTRGQAAARDIATTRRSLEDEARKLAARRGHAADEVVNAREAGSAADAAFWRERQTQYALALRDVERRVRALADDEVADAAVGAREVSQIEALANDMPRLLAELRTVPGAARRFLRDCGITVHAHTPGKYAIRLDVEFPTGHRARRWVFTQPIPSSQALRVYAAGRLVAGDGPAAVAEDLNTLLPSEVRAPWTRRRVRGVVAFHRAAEPETPRVAAHVTVGLLAARVDAPVEAVLAVTLAGALGPAMRAVPARRSATEALYDGTLDPTADGSAGGPAGAPFDGAQMLVAPTEAELHAAFPEYARRETAAAYDWDLDDTLRLADAARRTWQPSANVRQRANRVGVGRRGMQFDFAGRAYVRLSDVRCDAIDAAVEEAFARDPSLTALDPFDWALVAGDGSAPGRERSHLVPHAPTLVVPTARPGNHRTYAWLGPPVLARAVRASLEAAVAASPHAGLPVDEWHPAPEVLTRLRARLGDYPTRPTFQRLVYESNSCVPSVEALGLVRWQMHRHVRWQVRSVHYIHIPASVMRAGPLQTVRAWLEGKVQPVRVERRSRRAQRDRYAPEREAEMRGTVPNAIADITPTTIERDPA